MQNSDDHDAARAAHEIAHSEKLSQGDIEGSWGWGSPAGRERAQRRGRMLSDGARLQPGMRVLEIGCGTGLFTEMLAQSGATIVAVDISDAVLRIAAGRGLPADRVTFLRKRFEDCDVDGPFDAVVGSSVLHHLELEPALARIHDLLAPEGVISFAEPNMLNPQVWLERHLRFLFPQVSPDETAFLRRRLWRLLAGAGFAAIEVIPHGWLHPAVPGSWVPRVKRIEGALESIPFVKEFAGSLYIRAQRGNGS